MCIRYGQSLIGLLKYTISRLTFIASSQREITLYNETIKEIDNTRPVFPPCGSSFITINFSQKLFCTNVTI